VQQLGMFTYVSVEEPVPADHPSRKLRVMVDAILMEMNDVQASRYSAVGCESIPPERLLRASLLQVVYSVRSERLLMERLNYNLLFRWFVGLNVDDPAWDHSSFSFNRARLFDAEIAQRFFEHTVLLARRKDRVSDDHFSVDGTLLKAWASHKSFRPKDDDDKGDGGDFHGQTRSNHTHASTTDPDARLIRKGKGKEAKLSYLANALMENRNGLLVGVDVRHATGTGQRDGALALVDASLKPGTALCADKGYDTRLRRAAETARHRCAHRASCQRPTQRDRWTQRTQPWLRDESAGAQTHRAGLRLGQDHRWTAQTSADRHRRRTRSDHMAVCRLQPDPSRRHRSVLGSVADLRKGAS
jgi:transposase